MLKRIVAGLDGVPCDTEPAEVTVPGFMLGKDEAANAIIVVGCCTTVDWNGKRAEVPLVS